MESAGSGRIIAGRYRLGNVIGRGGMGVVWQARDELLSRDVAVKELTWPAYFSGEEQQAACRRATREAKTAARLSHRNVIRIFDIIEEDGCPWIVMELLPPRSLHDVIEQEGPLSPAQAAAVGLGILAAPRPSPLPARHDPPRPRPL
jgi:eukaryotic-like serine/threonine-protein kinase